MVVQSELREPPGCLLARYAELDAKIPALKLKHGSDAPGFAAEYAKEKEKAVGHLALASAGCMLSK